MFQATNIHYELSDNVRGTSYVVGAMHLMARNRTDLSAEQVMGIASGRNAIRSGTPTSIPV